MKRILFLLFLCVNLLLSKSEFSEPKPSFDKPRKVVFQLFDSDLKKVNHTIGSIYNILKEYPSETLKIAVVVYGNGMRALKKDYDKNTLKRIQSLMEYDIEFIACKNTMKSMKWTKKDFIEDISYVQAGLVDVIEKKVDGYIGIIAF